MNISKEAKVGILALVSFSALYLGFNFLKGSAFFSSENTYTVIYTDVQGLVPSSQVALSGMKVGQVKDVVLLNDAGHKVKVVLSIRKDLSIPAGTKAVLASDGLLGGKLIRLDMGQGAALADGGILAGASETGITDILKEKALPTLTHADSLMRTLRTVAEGFKGTSAALNALLKNSNTTVTTLGTSLNSTLADNKANLNGITANLKVLSGNLVETEKQFKPLLGKFNKMADSLNALKVNQALATTQKSLDELQKVLAGIQAGNGTIGKMLKDDSLYTNLNRTMVDLDKLLVDFRLAPKRYVHLSVFGKKATPPVVK
ncbi:MlaD family protein [Flectobacillus major]|uniref:MlaD family protein n=1 Tax=Flectobacillus major TaxID=103 RepID=UPI000406B1D0|nr:MlaD family protein [Flectobacillus major]